MANNEKISDHNGQKIEKESERAGASRVAREQRPTMPRIKDRIDETRLPTPPSDPWLTTSQWYPRNTPAELTQPPRNFEEEDDEDMLAYSTDLETPPSESQASDCPSRNSTASTITHPPNLCTEEAFDHLNRLYSFTEQIIELRHRTANFFKRVRNLEKLKVLRNANRALEDVFASDYDAANDFCEEDTGFADSLLDAMISNCREPAFQRRSTRTARRPRSKFDFQKQTSGDDVLSKNAPKVSKWTRVKAAFKWERAYANDAAESTDTAALSTPTTPIAAPTAKYLAVPDVDTGNSGSSSPSFYVDDVSDTGTPFSRTSTASLSNEASCECSLKNISNRSDHPRTKEDTRREECTDRRSQSLDRNVVVPDVEQANDNGQEKEAVRATEEKNGTVYPSNGIDAKNARLTSKRPPPSLTITIPPINDDIRCVPSPESNSSVSSSAHTPTGNSPLLRNIHREQSSIKHFKRQQSAIEESIASRIRGQDSKWSKVRRAFLTNSPLCIPPSPVKVVSRQMFLQNGEECSTPGSCSASAEDLEQLTTLNAQTDTQRDYRVLREKLGAEFHQKLVEWERIKNLSPRPRAKDSREASSNNNSLNPRDHFLSEERLSFEFRKKLQDWKRVKKERRGSTSFEQQRFNRRRLTDWQLWKSPLKIECRNRGITGGQHTSCGESVINGGRSRLSEDFLRKMDVWKRINEATNNCDTEPPARSKLNRLGIGSGIDESEFLTLEKALSLFNRNTTKERRENDTHRSDKFIDRNTKSYIGAGSNANYTDQVLVQTPAGAYRFEGISREFTRKLYDWEKYRGISPRSSTFRLLGPAFDPLLTETNNEIPITPITKSGSGEQVFFSDRSFRRSKSVDHLIGRSSLNESFIRRPTSLQLLNHMANTLENSSRTDSNCRRVEETTEDILMDDSEPEAMIVDIEDVIEETASPLKRMQPHQTPVYSVAASETTSIAVPLGTVTSSHEPSPVLFIEIDDTLDRKPRKPNDRDRRNCFAVENNSDVEYFASGNVSNDTRHSSSNEDVNSDCSSTLDSMDGDKYRADQIFHSIDRDSRKDFTETNNVRRIEKNRKCGIAEESVKLADEDSFEKKEVLSGPSNEGSVVVVDTVTTEQRFDGSDECETVRRWNLGKHSTLATSIKESTDLSSEEKHDRECDDDRKAEQQDGGTCNVKDVTEVLTRLERGNEYENVKSVEDPYHRSLIDRRPPINYETCNTERLSGLSATYKSESTTWEGGSYRASPENEGESRDPGKRSDSSSRAESSELERGSFESYARRLDRQKENHRAGDARLEESTATAMQRDEQKLENVSSSMLPVRNSYNCAQTREPTARTTSFTVDEEILKNAIVRSIGKGCAGSAKALKQSIDGRAANDLAREQDRRSSSDDNTPVNFEKPAKKRYSPTRNMFVKTKRMIFSPFRREEDCYFSRRKNSNGSDSDQACSPKTKGKSRSASPKMNRQDMLSRMSFSLPWPIGSFSKDQETKEPRTETEIVYKNKRTSSLTTENDVFRESSFQSTTVKFADEAKRATSDKQGEYRASAVSFGGKREAGRNETSRLEFDRSPSDLMHKLQILSRVVAKRDGRSTISEELSVESRSLRMRRAKEDFLSRRGGPLFHSVVEPSVDDQSFPRSSTSRHVPGKRDTSDSNNASQSVPSVWETKRKTTDTLDAGTVNEDETIDASSGSDASLSDRAKYASTGMINVDPDIFDRPTESGRGCESLPRTSSKLQKADGPLAKIVNKCKFIRLICGKEQNNLNTIARLCRQSLLIDIKNDFEKHWEADERANKPTREE